MMHPMVCADLVKAELYRCARICDRHFNFGRFPLVVRWDIRGAVAGTAWWGEMVRFNLMLLREQTAYDVRMVAAHEFAHIAVFKRWANEIIQDFRSQLWAEVSFNEQALLMSRYCEQEPDGHGPEWSAMMELFGYPPDQYHYFDVSGHV